MNDEFQVSMLSTEMFLMFNQDFNFFLLLIEKIRETSAQRAFLEKGLCCSSAAVFRECRTTKTSCESHTHTSSVYFLYECDQVLIIYHRLTVTSGWED